MIPVLSVEVLEEIVGASAALVLPAIAKLLGFEKLLERFPFQQTRTESQRSTAALLARVRTATAEMDTVVAELQAAADDRMRKVNSLESSINDLMEKEKNLKETIQGTEGLSKATVDALAGVIEEKLQKAERPKRRRDYALFAAGVIVSAVVGIGIEASKPVWERFLHIQPEHTEVSAPVEAAPHTYQPPNPKLRYPNPPENTKVQK